MIIEKLTWDSDFFDLNIGKSILESTADFENFDSTAGYDLVYLFSKNPIDNLNCIDEKIEFEKEIDPEGLYLSENVSLWEGDLTEDLIRLAILSGGSSRFKKDSKLNLKFEELYTRWILESVEGIVADFVLVVMEEENVLGFMTLKMHNTYSQIGLVAVREDTQGKGVGSQLMNKAFELTKENGKQFIRVVTQQENIDAINYYSKNGYSIYKKEYIYHYWLK